ncbi:MAG: hypothetical protein HKN47_14635 [Pirellulaceae bacterium]|nr:hypothetical protein [Pirellulaceae bacterium]
MRPRRLNVDGIALRGGGPRSSEWGTPVAGGWIKTIFRGFATTILLALLFATLNPLAHAAEPKSRSNPFSGLSSSAQRKEVLRSLPLNRLTPAARERITDIANSPTIYRRLPTQAIECDCDMFLFLTRKPEALVGIWELMGITQVQSQRTGPYQLEAVDGAGTTCKVDLIYGDSNLHIFVADGSYDGKMVPKPIRGEGVFVMRSSYGKTVSGQPTVTGTIDCFVKFDNLGADLVARTLSGVIGRSADNNFIETARFVGQVSHASAQNPPAMIDVAQRLPQVDEVTKKQFADVISTVARRAEATDRVDPASQTVTRRMTRRTQ